MVISYIFKLILNIVYYRDRKTTMSKRSRKGTAHRHSLSHNNHGSLRQVKMTEDEIFLHMLLETFSPPPTDSSTGIGM